jgi:anthranilate synthase / indole-3-glycerol phosphate synthase / phosphoribosylanthranilate isomerase
MEPLVEVNNKDEIWLALRIGARLIGINNRNLHDFTVDMETTTSLAAIIPDGKDVVLCALSGISTRADVERCLRDKVHAVLVGEALMRAENPTAFIANLFNLPELSGGGTPPPPLVKIYRIRKVEEAIECAEAGVDFIGFVFVPGSKRIVSVDDARRIASVLNESRSSLNQTETEIGVGMEMAPWFTTNARSINSERSRGRSRLLVGVF